MAIYKKIRHCERTEAVGDAGGFLVHNCYSSLAASIHIPVRNSPLSHAVMDSWWQQFQVLSHGDINYVNLN